MREILYRGKRTDNGKWVYGYYVGITAKNTHEKYSIFSINNNTEYEIDPDTLGQFTGLTDKNGTKIFEGDIINIPIGKRVMYTYWNEETMQWELADVGTELSVINHTINCFALSELQLEWCYEGEASYEVISNIHDTITDLREC